MSRSHHPVEKAMAPVPVRDARQSFPPFDGVFSPFKHGSIRHGRTARTADRAVLVELRRFLAGVHAHWDVPDVHEVLARRSAPTLADPRSRSASREPSRAPCREAVDQHSGTRDRCRSLSATIRFRQACKVAILPEHPGDPPDGWPARSGRSRGGPLGWMSRTGRMLGLQGPLEGAYPGSGRGVVSRRRGPLERKTQRRPPRTCSRAAPPHRRLSSR